MTYQEIETGKKSKYYFYKDNVMVAKVENDELTTYFELTEQEIEEIKKTASL